MIKINNVSAIDALSPIGNTEKTSSEQNNGNIGLTASFSELFNNSGSFDDTDSNLPVEKDLPDFDTKDEVNNTIFAQSQPQTQSDLDPESSVANRVQLVQNALTLSQVMAEQSDEPPALLQSDTANKALDHSELEFVSEKETEQQSKKQESSGRDELKDTPAESEILENNKKDDIKNLTRLSVEPSIKTEPQAKAYVREVTQTLNNIYQTINSEVEAFQSSNTSSGLITIRIKPSTLGEIVITLEQLDLNKGQEKLGTHSVDARIYTSNPEVANYLNLIRRDIYSQGMVRTLSIQSGMSNKDDNKASIDHEQIITDNSEQGPHGVTDIKSFFFDGHEKEEINHY